MTLAPTDIWTVLLPVIIGGALTFLGTTIAPIIGAWWSGRQETQKLRIQRFEELLAAVVEYDHWIERTRKERVFGGDRVTEMSPIFRAIGIASIYFPSLIAALEQLETAERPYRVWMIGAQTKRLNGDIQGLNDGFSEAYKPYYAAFSEFRRHASKYALDRKGKV